MSTQYRVVITCDEQQSPRCAGLLELNGPTIRVADRAAFVPLERGWLRGYGPCQTHDICPACKPVVARQLPLPGFEDLAPAAASAGEREGQGEEHQP